MRLLFFASPDDLLAAIKPGRADVVAQVRLAAGRLDRDRGRAQVIVRAAHAAPGRRLLVLVNCHLYDSSLDQCLLCISPRSPANGEVLSSRSSFRPAVQLSCRGAYGTARISSSSISSRSAISLPATTRSGPCASAGSPWISASVAASTSVSSVCTSNAIGSRQR